MFLVLNGKILLLFFPSLQVLNVLRIKKNNKFKLVFSLCVDVFAFWTERNVCLIK